MEPGGPGQAGAEHHGLLGVEPVQPRGDEFGDGAAGDEEARVLEEGMDQRVGKMAAVDEGQGERLDSGPEPAGVAGRQRGEIGLPRGRRAEPLAQEADVVRLEDQILNDRRFEAFVLGIGGEGSSQRQTCSRPTTIRSSLADFIQGGRGTRRRRSASDE